MSEKNVITLKQLQEHFENSKLTASQKRNVADKLGIDLPDEPIPELSDQLQEVKVVRGHVGKATKRNPKPQPKDYITVPSLKLENDGARGFWLKTNVARAVAKRILEVCDAEGIE